MHTSKIVKNVRATSMNSNLPGYPGTYPSISPSPDFAGACIANCRAPPTGARHSAWIPALSWQWAVAGACVLVFGIFLTVHFNSTPRPPRTGAERLGRPGRGVSAGSGSKSPANNRGLPSSLRIPGGNRHLIYRRQISCRLSLPGFQERGKSSS